MQNMYMFALLASRVFLNKQQKGDGFIRLLFAEHIHATST